jgi:hypothetical protein
MGTEIGLGVGISPSHLIPFQSASVSVRMWVEIEWHQERRGEEEDVEGMFTEGRQRGGEGGRREGISIWIRWLTHWSPIIIVHHTRSSVDEILHRQPASRSNACVRIDRNSDGYVSLYEAFPMFRNSCVMCSE